MPKIRIEYEHDVCVGTAACAAMDPKHFEMLDDGKSHIISSKEEKPEKWAWEGDVPEEELPNIMTAAQACPVNAIHVIVDGEKKI